MEQVRVELDEIGNLVNAANIPEDDRRMAAWCLQKLPALCQAFRETYESRYADEITRLERGLVMRFADQQPATSAQTRELAISLTTRFQSLHEQLGLPEFQPAKQRTAPARAKKTA
jgi:hypothetical protein